MLRVNEVREQLRDRNKVEVSRRTGIDRQTIYNVMKDGSNPRSDTLETLSDYLEKKGRFAK